MSWGKGNLERGLLGLGGVRGRRGEAGAEAAVREEPGAAVGYGEGGGAGGVGADRARGRGHEAEGGVWGGRRFWSRRRG